MKKQIRKKLVFGEPQFIEVHFNGRLVILPFSMVDSNLEGKPEEEYYTTEHVVKIQISRTLVSCWGFETPDLIKVLFEYAKRHIEKRLKEGKLAEEEELNFHTGNSQNPCPFNPSRIPNPNGVIVHIDIDEKDTLQLAKFDSKKAERIFRIKDFELTKKHDEQKQGLTTIFESSGRIPQINDEKTLSELFEKHIMERSEAYIESLIQAIEEGKLVDSNTKDKLVEMLHRQIDTDLSARKNLLHDHLVAKSFPSDTKNAVLRGFLMNISRLKQYCSDKLILEIEQINYSVRNPANIVNREKIRDKMEWDAFISHASEDKEEVVEPLAAELTRRGLKIWYDKYVLKIGDKLLQKIDEGLANSNYGIVIISHSFFKKDWPQLELEGLVQKEVGSKKVILPVWHNISVDEVKRYSPIMAGRVAGQTKKGIEVLADELISAMSDKNDSPD